MIFLFVVAPTISVLGFIFSLLFGNKNLAIGFAISGTICAMLQLSYGIVLYIDYMTKEHEDCLRIFSKDTKDFK